MLTVFLDYYFDLLTYLHQRKKRVEAFKLAATSSRTCKADCERQWKQHCLEERALLRKRRTRTSSEQFHILTKIGQGAFGQVGDLIMLLRTLGGFSCLQKGYEGDMRHQENEQEHSS